MEIEGVVQVLARIKKLFLGEQPEVSVIVGYTQAYAIYVHENMEAHHHVGQAKFLEEPLRQLAPELARMVAEAKRRGIDLGRALLLAGLRLQRESQLLCPVDTGALRASAFTAMEEARGPAEDAARGRAQAAATKAGRQPAPKP